MSHRIRPLFDLLIKAQNYFEYGLDMYIEEQQGTCQYKRVNRALDLVSEQLAARGFNPYEAYYGNLQRLEYEWPSEEQRLINDGLPF